MKQNEINFTATLSVLVQNNFRVKNVVGICEVVLRLFETAIF